MCREKEGGRAEKWLFKRLLGSGMCHFHSRSLARASHMVKPNVHSLPGRWALIVPFYKYGNLTETSIKREDFMQQLIGGAWVANPRRAHFRLSSQDHVVLSITGNKTDRFKF